jgi:ATP-dependent Lon protease
MEENGVRGKLRVIDKALLAIIHQYTREAGLRNLEREISQICRKVARRIAEGEKGPFSLTPKNLSRYLGVPKFLPETEGEKDEVGVATGLAWTPTGGDILFVEVSLVKGKERHHHGSLETSEESAQAAITYARSRATRFGLARISTPASTSTSTFPRARSPRTVPPPGSRSPPRSFRP